MAELEQSTALVADGSTPPDAPPLPSAATWLPDAEPLTPPVAANDAAAIAPAGAAPVAETTALCTPLSPNDPCGPDLDLAGDADFLNFLAQAEGLLPSSFFSVEDGRPFDRAGVDLKGAIAAMAPLWERSRDLRLLTLRARLMILDRDLAGFADTLAAIAQWLESYWDDVHPRAEGGDLGARIATLGSLDLPTVVFPLQYAPLCEARRIGAVSYRTWMIATGEVKPRPGEQQHPSATVSEAIADAEPDSLAATRRQLATLRSALQRIRNAFVLHNASAGLDALPALVDKVIAFADPHAADAVPAADEGETSAEPASSDASAARPAPAAPMSLAEAQEALAAIADYYRRCEPSSPTLPLIRQAHQLIGKSFFEVMSILVPSQIDKAAFQIGSDQFFELPVGKLSKLSEGAAASAGDGAAGSATASANGGAGYRVESRGQAIALLDQVQRFFRLSEPSSPVPMLCERARALAERDFMGVLRDVLPKAALKTFGAEK